ncbi:SixA phosphatase family protein [Pseudoxanthomonas sacheonensis]|uniref:Phosphohistidine phosphatase SixA n=1 Tax=Pseudoxanthomonas sacheonensis TaxID=443615 RepID=A0ABU1RU74_9GAMM|nr:phosphoglycerate mutase family protein [Pseudoxanthomonas sacheonensis]MDR6842320.1 phosphohistidine phosphatase SixA [Pseudoxanthomonas sacheonensis]
MASCSIAPARDADTVTFVVVRHAEKGADDPRDPSLSQVGQARAQRLATLLNDTTVNAVYATAYRRTYQTARPVAENHFLRITTYDAQMPASQFVEQLRRLHKVGTVLVVGHSNTVPDIVGALSGRPVEAIGDDEFDRLYRIRIGADGKAALSQETY